MGPDEAQSIREDLDVVLSATEHARVRKSGGSHVRNVLCGRPLERWMRSDFDAATSISIVESLHSQQENLREAQRLINFNGFYRVLDGICK